MVPTALAVTYVILSMPIYYKSTANSASHLSNKQMQFEGPMSVGVFWELLAIIHFAGSVREVVGASRGFFRDGE